jgi:hypothetical protein
LRTISTLATPRRPGESGSPCCQRVIPRCRWG